MRHEGRLPKPKALEKLEGLAKVSGYSIVGRFVDRHTKITMRCNKHKITFEALPRSCLSEQHGAGIKGCPKCKAEKISEGKGATGIIYNVVAKFHASYKRGKPDDCWPWQLSLRNGYGQFTHPELGVIGAHVFALELKLKRRLHFGMLCRHSCHNPQCVNPSHLCEGVDQDNSDDKLAAERQARGISQGHAKLDERKVKQIRKSNKDQYVLAQKYGVSQSTISAVQTRKTWKHI